MSRPPAGGPFTSVLGTAAVGLAAGMLWLSPGSERISALPVPLDVVPVVLDAGADALECRRAPPCAFYVSDDSGGRIWRIFYRGD